MHASQFVSTLATRSIAGQLGAADALRILEDSAIDQLSLVQAAFEVRKQSFGRRVQIHVINNASNGHCPEDCSYCSQAKTSEVDIEKYPPKQEDEILAEAKRAYESGAHRYCMVFAGRGPSTRRTQKLAALVRRIKETYPIEVCVSAGLLDEPKAEVLREAGLDRYNHNLNTSEETYAKICTTHTYADRINTVKAARKAGLSVCSGMIVGMGESAQEVVEVAGTLGKLAAASIPVNFLLPFEGTALDANPAARQLTPDYCLRVLCMFRLMNPMAEVRIAAGREVHLRSLQALALYPANSLFLDGYLNSRGDAARSTLRMIEDAGFEIVSDFDVKALLAEKPQAPGKLRPEPELVPLHALKSKRDLRPTLTS